MTAEVILPTRLPTTLVPRGVDRAVSTVCAVFAW